VSISWDHMAYFSPNGYEYAYFLREEGIDGWTVYRVDSSGKETLLTEVESAEGSYEGEASSSTYSKTERSGTSSGTIINKYGDTGSLKITKIWDPKNSAYNLDTLPDSVTLRLYRHLDAKETTDASGNPKTLESKDQDVGDLTLYKAAKDAYTGTAPDGTEYTVTRGATAAGA